MIVQENINQIVKSSEGIFNISKELLNARQDTEKHKEYFYTFYLDAKNEIKCIDLASIGTVNQCHPIIREILRLGLIKNAVSLIIVHNHPSGNIVASKEDIIFTKKLQEACKLLGLKLLDHIILANTKYNSLNDNSSIVF